MGGGIGALMLGASIAPAFAAPAHTNFGINLNASQCDVKQAPIVNVTFKVVNDTDSGFYGDWAKDNYSKKIQIWDQEEGTFCAIVKYQGQFVTTGPNSPQNGDPLSAGIKGTFEGGYQANFDGSFTPLMKTQGNLGTFDYNVAGFDWIATYFTGNSTFDQPYWAWNYHAGNNGSWVNASTGSFGDITGS